MKGGDGLVQKSFPGFRFSGALGSVDRLHAGVEQRSDVKLALRRSLVGQLGSLAGFGDVVRGERRERQDKQQRDRGDCAN